MAYDIIGDIHGHAGKLETLLRKLGYSESRGSYRHPSRTVVFVGDFIDRGPEQLRTVDIARRMVDAGAAQAVMGNHELNAIAWHTPHPGKPGEYLRPRTHPKWGDKNRKQHAAFLAEVEGNPAKHADIIEWFLTLPLWQDLSGVRVVHACWHAAFMAWLSPRLRDGRYLTRDLLPAATQEPVNESEKDDPVPSVFKAVEALTKGLEVPLPKPHKFVDKDGVERDRVRVRWWERDAKTYRKAAILPAATREALPDLPIPHQALAGHPSDKPIFFGHYWMNGATAVLSPTATCVDYSAGNGGELVAYRWDGERELDGRNFVSTP